MPAHRPALPAWVDRLLRVEVPTGDVLDWPRAEEWTDRGAVLNTREPGRYAAGQVLDITPMEPSACPRPRGRPAPVRRLRGVVQEVVATAVGAFVLVHWLSGPAD